MDWYDRQGNNLGDTLTAIEFETHVKNFRVAEDTVINSTNGKTYLVSTVHLGFNHEHRTGKPPLIFETMVFDNDDNADVYMERYSTEQQAVESHNRICDGIKDNTII